MKPEMNAALVETTPPRKVFTISLELDLGPHKTSKARLQTAYEQAVSAAVSAVRGELLDNSIETVTHCMSYDYRHLDDAATEEVSPDGELIPVTVEDVRDGVEQQVV